MRVRRVSRELVGPFGRRMGAKLLPFLFCLLGCACSHLTSHVITDPTPAIDRLRSGGDVSAEVDLLACPIMESGDNLGIVVGVLTPDGAARCFGYGTTDLQGGSVPTGDTIFGLGSLTKCFVTSLLTVLADKGILSCDDTIGDILPPSVELSKEVGSVTLLELALHQTGIGRERASFRFFLRAIGFLFTGENLYGHIDQETIYDYLEQAADSFDPDKPYLYSNVGLGLLGHLMELKTGQSLDDLLQQHICRPLRMTDTSFVLSDEQKDRLATGHAGSQPLFLPRHAPMPDWTMSNVMFASAGLYSTAQDLLLFLRSNLAFDWTRMSTLFAENHKTLVIAEYEDVATGWFTDDIYQGEVHVVFQFGMIAGHTAYMAIEESAQVGVVVLCNNLGLTDNIGHNLIVRLSKAFKR